MSTIRNPESATRSDGRTCKMRSRYILVGVVVGVLLASMVVVLAGSMDSPEGPTHADAQMYTLEQIYDRLDTGAESAKMTQFTEPVGGPGTGTMFTLDEIMAKAPQRDDTNGATQADVLINKTYWSRRTASWGHQAGTMPDREGDSASTGQAQSAGVNYFTAPEGYYDGDDRVSATDAEVRALDADLTVGNIKKDVDIFGQVGTLTPDGGTAVTADLFEGRTAHLTGDWTLDTGTLDLACNDPSFDGIANKVPNAYDGGGNGNNRWCMTDSGDAAAADILQGKKAWVDGSEVTGSYAGTTCTGDATTEDVLYPKTFSNSIATGLTGKLHGGCTCCITCTLYESRWCDNEDGTVTDLTTCLVWLKAADWGSNGVWCGAHTRAGKLKAGTSGAGLSDGSVVGDWRLPTKSEFDHLLNGSPNFRCTAVNSDCSKYGFTGIAGRWSAVGGATGDYGYWTSTTTAGNDSRAHYIKPATGAVSNEDKSWWYGNVWPVRGGQ